MQQYYLDQLELTPWVLRKDQHRLSLLKQLVYKTETCQHCPLQQTRTQTEFAQAIQHAKLMIIGAAPEIPVIRENCAFSGGAKTLLDLMMAFIGLTRQDVCLSTLVKCGPSADCDFHHEAINLCATYLTQQIEIVKPKVILALGQVPAQILLNTTQPITLMRSQNNLCQNIPVVVSHHPTYLLENPLSKQEAYADWLALKRLMAS